jgi:hypothetical protein
MDGLGLFCLLWLCLYEVMFGVNRSDCIGFNLLEVS